MCDRGVCTKKIIIIFQTKVMSMGNMGFFKLVIAAVVVVVIGYIVVGCIGYVLYDPYDDPATYRGTIKNFADYRDYQIYVPVDKYGVSAQIATAEIYDINTLRLKTKLPVFSIKSPTYLTIYGEGTKRLHTGEHVKIYYIYTTARDTGSGESVEVYGIVDKPSMDYMLKIPGAYILGLGSSQSQTNATTSPTNTELAQQIADHKERFVKINAQKQEESQTILIGTTIILVMIIIGLVFAEYLPKPKKHRKR